MTSSCAQDGKGGELGWVEEIGRLPSPLPRHSRDRCLGTCRQASPLPPHPEPFPGTWLGVALTAMINWDDLGWPCEVLQPHGLSAVQGLSGCLAQELAWREGGSLWGKPLVGCAPLAAVGS